MRLVTARVCLQVPTSYFSSEATKSQGFAHGISKDEVPSTEGLPGGKEYNPAPHPSKQSSESESYLLMHPVYSKEYVESVKPKHRPPVNVRQPRLKPSGRTPVNEHFPGTDCTQCSTATRSYLTGAILPVGQPAPRVSCVHPMAYASSQLCHSIVGCAVCGLPLLLQHSNRARFVRPHHWLPPRPHEPREVAHPHRVPRDRRRCPRHDGRHDPPPSLPAPHAPRPRLDPHSPGRGAPTLCSTALCHNDTTVLRHPFLGPLPRHPCPQGKCSRQLRHRRCGVAADCARPTPAHPNHRQCCAQCPPSSGAIPESGQGLDCSCLLAVRRWHPDSLGCSRWGTRGTHELTALCRSPHRHSDGVQ